MLPVSLRGGMVPILTGPIRVPPPDDGVDTLEDWLKGSYSSADSCTNAVAQAEVGRGNVKNSQEDFAIPGRCLGAEPPC